METTNFDEKGVDTEGAQYDSLKDMWNKELSSGNEWYTKAGKLPMQILALFDSKWFQKL
jgi:hypothetical protein